MKTAREEIAHPVGSSIRLMVNPNLSDFFFWHFHPEYELVFIAGADGTRHVGEHISRFSGSDLVMIGPNIPHLNFDYGIKAPYTKTVVHIKTDFLGQVSEGTPELQPIHHLLSLSQHGIAFGEQTKKRVEPLVQSLHELPNFERFLALLSILKLLQEDPDKQLLHQSPFKNPFKQKDQDRLAKVYAFIDAHYWQRIEIAHAAQIACLSEAAFCRYFKKMTRLTFIEFLNHYRIDKAKKLLLMGHNVTEAGFGAGFESLSYFNRTFKKITGDKPLQFRGRHK